MRRDDGGAWAPTSPARASLQTTLLQLRGDWLGCALLGLAEGQADALAQRLVRADPYGEIGHLRHALRLAGCADDDALLQRHLAHRLWCEARDAQWMQGGTVRPLRHRVEGAHWYQETAGHPTLLVLPMTLALVDSLDVIRRVLRGRPCIVYGEGVVAPEGDGIEVAGEGLRAVRRIHEVLAAHGVLCTYADFAYAHHAAVPARLFGTERPVARGFVSLALRQGVHLLPLSLTLDASRETCTCAFSESLCIGTGGGTAPEDRHPAMAGLVAQLLEQAIAVAPWQWLLLPTLAFDTCRQHPDAT